MATQPAPVPAPALIPEPALPATATAKDALEALARWVDEWVEAVEDLAVDDVHYDGKIEGFRAVARQARFWARQLPPKPAEIMASPCIATYIRGGK